MWQVIVVALVIGAGVPLALFLAGWVAWLCWRTARDSLPEPVPPVRQVRADVRIIRGELEGR